MRKLFFVASDLNTGQQYATTAAAAAAEDNLAAADLVGMELMKIEAAEVNEDAESRCQKCEDIYIYSGYLRESLTRILYAFIGYLWIAKIIFYTFAFYSF
jgi:hypothetical protein